MEKIITSRLFQLVIAGTVAFTNYANAQSNPTPYNAWPANYVFNNWPATSPAGTYPTNMIFHYADTNQVDPDLSEINASEDYVLAYNLTSQSRIEGWGANGFSFVNTSPGHSSDSTGNLGEAVLALNTSSRANVQVSWRAGTMNTPGRAYKLRAQYRVGTTGAYTDFPYTTLSDIEYTSPLAVDSPGVSFGPIVLPTACDNKPVVQIRWAYYYSGTGSSTRAKINLADITVTSAASGTTGINEMADDKSVLLYPNPVNAGENILLSEPVSGIIYDVYGRSVFTVKNSDRISTTNYSKGLYTLQTIQNGTIRFVIN